MPHPTMYKMRALPEIIVERLPEEAEMRMAAKVKNRAVLYREVGKKLITVRGLIEFERLFEPVK